MLKRLFILILLVFASSEARAQDARRIIGGDILHSATASDASETKAMFLAEQAAVKAVILECGFAHRARLSG